MPEAWKDRLDILGPIEQAARCLDLWLKEEKRRLPEKQRRRAAALMARYFHHEDQMTDQVLLSFLRHYSGRKIVDMEDPTSVRMEIKAVLDKSSPKEFSSARRKGIFAALAAGALLMAVSLGAWEVNGKTITRDQQAELKTLVHHVAALDKSTTPAALWAELKAPLRVKSYQDIPWWNYRQSRELLEKRLAELQQK